jgi:peroxiredoxin
VAAVALLGGFTAAREWESRSALDLEGVPRAEALVTARAAAGVVGTEAAGSATAAAPSEPDTGGLSYGVVETGKANVGELAPDFTLELSGGSELSGQGVQSLADYRGRPVLLNFFATWCTPCRVEMPFLQAAYDRHEADGLVVLGVDVQESPEVVPPFLEELGLDFPVVLDRAGEVTRLYRVRSMPTTYLIDAEGDVAHVWPGMFSSETQLDDALRYILP